MKISTSFNRFIRKKLATAVLVTASVAAFATLGDGGKKGQKKLFSGNTTPNYKNFSLKSTYNYRGNQLFSNESGANKVITLNTTITYQKGNATYILPMKKKVLLDKIKFKPTAP